MTNTAEKLISPDFLSRLTPLQQLSEGALRIAAEQVTVHEYGPFQRIPNHLTETCLLFVVAGQIELVTRSGRREILSENSEQGRKPLLQGYPRGSFAKALTHCSLLAIDRRVIDELGGPESTLASETPAPGAGAGPAPHWLRRFLAPRFMAQLTPRQIQSLLSSMQEIRVGPGAILAQEGDETSLQSMWFYVMKRGQCRLSSKSERYGLDFELPELGPGDSFGEDAICIRTLTATVQTPAELVRINRQDVVDNLIKPLVEFVTPEQLGPLRKCGARILDIRTEDVRPHSERSASLHIPLPHLRASLSRLSHDHTYVVRGEDAAAVAAAFLLLQHDFDACVLLLKPSALLERRRRVPRLKPTLVHAGRPKPVTISTKVAHKVQLPNPQPSEAPPKDAAVRAREYSAKLHEAQLHAERRARLAAEAEIARLKAEQQAGLASRGRSKTAARQFAIEAAARAKAAEQARRLAEAELERLKQSNEESQRRAETLAGRLANALDATRRAEQKLSKVDPTPSQTHSNLPPADPGQQVPTDDASYMDIANLPESLLWETALGLRDDAALRPIFGDTPAKGDSETQSPNARIDIEADDINARSTNLARFKIDGNGRRYAAQIVANTIAGEARSEARRLTARQGRRRRIRLALMALLLVSVAGLYFSLQGFAWLQNHVVADNLLKSAYQLGNDVLAPLRRL